MANDRETRTPSGDGEQVERNEGATETDEKKIKFLATLFSGRQIFHLEKREREKKKKRNRKTKKEIDGTGWRKGARARQKCVRKNENIAFSSIFFFPSPLFRSLFFFSHSRSSFLLNAHRFSRTRKWKRKCSK